MTDNRIPVTVISGGYNYNCVDKLITEECPRWSSSDIKFIYEDTDIRMYIDYPFEYDSNIIKPAKCSVAILEEPYWCVPHFNIFVRNNLSLFDCIYTNDTWLLSQKYENVKYYPGAQSQMSPEHRYINLKTKLICAIFSTKSYSEGHQLRQKIKTDLDFQRFVDFVNSVPHIENKIDDKWELTNPYMYEIAIENTFNELWTEKLLDCFLTGRIPIYKGNNRIQNYFNMNGIITFDTIEELKEIVKWISQDGHSHYQNVMYAIIDNFERVKKLINLGDVLWAHGLKNVFEEKGII